MAAVRRWFMNGTPPSVFRPPILLWNTPIAMAHKHFFKLSDFLWIGGRERIGDNRRHCSAILDDSPSVICFHPIGHRYSSFLSCAVHTLCTHCAADAHQWFAFTQSHSIYCIRIKLPGNYIPASIQLAFLYFLYDDMKRESSIAIWISLVIIHISQPRSQRNVVQQCN